MTTLKTVSYGVMHFSVAVAVAFAISGSWKTALAIGTLEPLIQTFAYHWHERSWEKNYTRVHAWIQAHPLPLIH